ncbi:MAG: hypothetical protein RLY93_05420 [Sumerlaeia bacterium]
MTSSYTLILRAALVLAATASMTASADEVIFTNGERRLGRVESVAGNPDNLVLISATGRLEIPRARIERVVEHDDPTDYTIIANQHYEAKNYTMALEMYQRALDSDPNFEPAQQGVASTRQALDGQRRSQEEQLSKENGELLEQARELIDSEDFERAEALIERVAGRVTLDSQKDAVMQARKNLYKEWGLSRVDRLDPEGGEYYLMKALQIDGNDEDIKDELLALWEKDPARQDRVLAIYQNKLQENPDDLSLNQKVAELLVQNRQYEAALRPLYKVYQSTQYRSSTYDAMLSNAMEQVAQTKAAEGKLDEALNLYRRHDQMFDTTDNAEEIAYLEYEKRRSELAPDDWQGQAALLQDLVNNGMMSLALQEADYILANDPDNEIATNLLRQSALSDLNEAKDAFQQGNYLLARELARTFPEKHSRFKDLVEEASDLFTKADIEAKQQAQQTARQAKEIALRGDQYFFQAQRFTELLKSSETSERTTVVSYKQEAIKYVQRAIQSYQLALQMDPSLGPITGADLNNKLVDSRSLYASLTQPPVRYPTRQRRPRLSQPTSD